MVATALCAQSSEPGFRHHYIADSIPETGRPIPGFGSPAVADFDKDGDPDFAVLTRDGRLHLLENQSGKWVRHEIGSVNVIQLGGAVLDVDRDGWTDIVIGGVWFRNPGKVGPFERYSYDPTIKTEIHDVTVADVNGDKRPDVVALGDREGLFWYEIPGKPARDLEWNRVVITDLVINVGLPHSTVHTI